MAFLLILWYLSPIILAIYLYVNKKYSFWKVRGVSGPRPIFPFGYLYNRMNSDPIQYELDCYKKYGKVYGVFNGMMPTLTISDVELIKQVLIKDFHLFMNRRKVMVLDHHWSKNLFLNQDEDWKRIRSIATPAFTSGKLRKMFSLLKQSTDKLESYFEKICKSSDSSFDVKKIISGFTIDVIASTSFGTDTDANGDRSKYNPFLHHGESFFKNISVVRLLLIFTMPDFVLKAMSIKHQFPYDSFDFFVNVCKSMLQRSNKRQDLITLLKEANISDEDLKNMNFNKLTASSDAEHQSETNNEKSSSKNIKFLTEEEIIAQCILFFVAGFETTASAITHSIFQLARNPDIQERLYEQVTEKLVDVDPNNLDEYYETITSKIPYLDAILKETLRMYPPVTRLERRLNTDKYQLGGILLEQDNLVEISTVAVHYDPDYYSDPFQYNPDRFMPENKDKLVPYSYIPFGDGPRNCVGMRFAYQKAKICLASLIQKFRFEANDKTPQQLRFPNSASILISESFQLSVRERSS